MNHLINISALQRVLLLDFLNFIQDILTLNVTPAFRERHLLPPVIVPKPITALGQKLVDITLPISVCVRTIRPDFLRNQTQKRGLATAVIAVKYCNRHEHKRFYFFFPKYSIGIQIRIIDLALLVNNRFLKIRVEYNRSVWYN